MAPGIATIPTIDTCSRMTLRFEDVQKLSLRVPKNRLSRIRATSRPPLWYAASRLATPRAPPAGRRRGAPGRRVVPGWDTAPSAGDLLVPLDERLRRGQAGPGLRRQHVREVDLLRVLALDRVDRRLG